MISRLGSRRDLSKTEVIDSQQRERERDEAICDLHVEHGLLNYNTDHTDH